MNKFQKRLIYLFFFIPLAGISCRDHKNIDVSNIQLELATKRFDKSFSQLNPDDLASGTALLKKQYGVFYEDYMSKILSVGGTSDTMYFKNLRTVLTSKDYLDLNHDVREKFPLLADRDEQLTDAFKHILYYYPKQKIPAIFSYVSGFSYQVVVGEGYIGIGLDMFLGADSRFYPALTETIPRYISRRYTPENIVPRVMEGFIRQEMHPETDVDNSLLDRMIYNGKIMYMMRQVMPRVEDSLLISYTSAQDDWSRKHESDVWAYFIDRELLYETDYMKIQKYLTDAPFTPGIGDRNDSAPKLGIFIGWQIVKKYMETNPTTTLPELFKRSDAQEFLNKSKYRPG